MFADGPLLDELQTELHEMQTEAANLLQRCFQSKLGNRRASNNTGDAEDILSSPNRPGT